MENIEITWQEVNSLEKDSYVLIDIRDESAVSYGMIPGAIHIPEEQLTTENDKISKEKKVIFYCTKGIFSK